MKRIEAALVPQRELAEAVVDVIQGGGTLIFPTDTVYGIGADPEQPAAIARIFQAKERPPGKPLSLHFATVAELLEYTDGNAMARTAARCFLPGALTIVVTRPSFVAAAISAGLDSIGLRVPDHPVCAAILESTGPLAATSANRSGEPAYTGANASDLPAADLFVDAGPLPLGRESTVVDLRGERPRLIREGAIPFARVLDALGAHDLPAGTGSDA